MPQRHSSSVRKIIRARALFLMTVVSLVAACVTIPTTHTQRLEISGRAITTHEAYRKGFIEGRDSALPAIEQYESTLHAADEVRNEQQSRIAQLERETYSARRQLGQINETLKQRDEKIASLLTLRSAHANVRPVFVSPPPTPRALTPAARTQIEGFAEQLDGGVIAWRPPRTMTQGVATDVTAAAAFLADRALLDEILDGSGDISVRERQITKSLVMSLICDDPTAFDILRTGDGKDEEQLVRPGSTTFWQWRVTPKRPGSFQLRLHAYLIFDVGGNREKKQRQPIPPESVVVTVSRAYQAALIWQGYKAQVVSVFAFPFVAWLAVASFQRYRRWRHEKKKENEPRILSP